MYLLNSPAYQAARHADQQAHAAIRRLLDGGDPPALPPPAGGSYGRWAPTLERLSEAHAAGGTPAVAEAYQELYRADDRLIALMGSGGMPPGVTAAAGDSYTPAIVTLEDLLAAQIPPIEFFIEQILYVGVTNLSGRPKVGKSWLAASMALALSTGGNVLGFRARLVKVLYLALEDSAGRIQDRFRKLQAQANRNLHVALGWRALNDGGLEAIDTAVVRERYQVVFIDTFSRVNGRADQMDPNEMTQIYAALQQLALRHGIAIVVVDHHRKSARNLAESDPIDDIFGSTAKASVVDCAIGLYCKHNSTDAVLKLVGRDFGDAEYALTWDPESFTWHRKEDPDKKPIRGRRKCARRRSTTASMSARSSKRSTPWAPPAWLRCRRSSRSTSATCSTCSWPWSKGASSAASPRAAASPMPPSRPPLPPSPPWSCPPPQTPRRRHRTLRTPRIPRVPRVPRIPRAPIRCPRHGPNGQNRLHAPSARNADRARHELPHFTNLRKDIMTIDLPALIGRDTQLRRVASTHGCELAGVCPLCHLGGAATTGTDRFVVWDKLGRWACLGPRAGHNGCDLHGDAIDYLRHRDGIGYREACERLGLCRAWGHTMGARGPAVGMSAATGV